MSNLIPSSRSGDLAPTMGVGVPGLARGDRRASRAVQAVQRTTLVRMASVQGHAMVQNEKLHEIDRLAREGMTGQAMLAKFAATLSDGDPFLADDLKFFADMAKVGKGEIIADTVSDFCEEGRR